MGIRYFFLCLTFEGGGWGEGMGDLRKKKSCGLISREKILARKYLAKKSPTLKKNIFHSV